LSIAPGPKPAALMGEDAEARVSRHRGGEGGPFTLLKVTETETLPSGALEGMMALTWPAPTKSGMALTVFAPCVTVTETPPSVLDSGNAVTCWPETGPSRSQR